MIKDFRAVSSIDLLVPEQITVSGVRGWELYGQACTV